MSSRCRAAALRFLKIRPRSVQEMRDKLAGKKFEQQDIDQTLDYLQSIDLLNDRVFADGWVRYRLSRPFGFRRIITELKAKGVPPDIIEQCVALAQSSYDQKAVTVELARRRAARLGRLEPQKRNKRVFDFLLRRGFSTEAALKAVQSL